MNLGTFKLDDNVTKHVGIDEVIYVLRKADKYVSWYEPRRFYLESLRHFPNYDEYIKELLYKRLCQQVTTVGHLQNQKNGGCV